MGDIPLMRAGLILMAIIAAVGGITLLVSPQDRDGKTKGERERIEAVAAATPAAEPQPVPPAAAADTASPAFACRVDAAGIALPDAVHESSGLALAAGGNALWTHNDSGDPLLHLVGTDGTPRGQVRITGARVTDWEDVSAGTCQGGGRCLYVGDVGDNEARRRSITLWRVPEPRPGVTQSAAAEAITATYPDGPRDAEAIFVLPDGGVHVVSKGETGPIVLYRLPRTARPGTSTRLERVAELAPGPVERSDRITGAAASPDGQWVVLRTLRSLSFYRAGGLASGQMGTPLTFDLRPLNEKQGEAVDWAANNTLYLSSEGGKKEDPATLSRLTCTMPT